MSRISSGKVKILMGIIMTMVMIVSLFAGIGTIWVHEDTTKASAVGTEYNGGKYTIPTEKASSKKGDGDNPFVVLEIVPDASGAQFGYLVKGQEPVNLVDVALDPNAATYATMLQKYLELHAADSDKSVSEFYDLVTPDTEFTYTVTEGGKEVEKKIKYLDSGFLWDTAPHAATMYGEYKLNSENAGQYALVEEMKKEMLGYVALKEDSIGQEFEDSYLSSDPAVSGKTPRTFEEVKASIVGELPATQYALIDNKDLYVPVSDGDGLYSSRVYNYVGENKGPFSLLHKYVTTGGDSTIKITLPEIEVYTTTNTIKREYYREYYYDLAYYNDYTRGFNNQGGTYVAFKRKTTEGPDVPTYSIKAYSNSVYNNGNDNDFYYKYYKLKTADASDYDISIDEDKDWMQKIRDYIDSKANTYTYLNDVCPASIEVDGKTFTRTIIDHASRSAECTGYDAADLFHSDSTVACRVDSQYFYLHNNSEGYYKVEYTSNGVSAKDIPITSYYVFEYTSSYSTTPGNDYYIVLFEYDPEGKYVVDTSVSGSLNNRKNHMAYSTKKVGTGKGGWEWISKTNGDYLNIEAIASTTFKGIPQPVYRNDVEKINGRVMEGLTAPQSPVHLGEYSETLYSLTALYAGDTEGTTKICAKDYDHYKIVPVYKDTNTYTYSVKLLTDANPEEGVRTVLGTYDWEGKNLAESNAITNDASKPDANSNGFKDEYEPELFLKAEGDPKQFDGEAGVPSSILGYKPDKGYFVGYLGGYKNYDLFKKFSVGLAYDANDRTKSSDVDSFEFVEWCTDPNGMNPFTESTSVNGNMTLYAKWLIKYPEDLELTGEAKWSGYTISFNPNVPEGKTVSHMPGIETTKTVGVGADAHQVNEYLVTGISRNALISAPDNKPVCDGYLFAGWYLDAACKKAFDFSGTRITDDLIRNNTPGAEEDAVLRTLNLYAKWTPLGDYDSIVKYNFTLDANTVLLPNGTSVTMPAETAISNVALNGRIYTRQEGGTIVSSEVTIPTPTADRSDYTFAGWYLDRSCNYRFEFVPEVIEKLDNTVGTVLYAKWIFNDPDDPDSRPRYSVTFNGNKPSKAVASVEGLDTQFVYCGDTVSYASRPKPTLSGNIDAKLDGYNVQVVTVTPKDFTGSNKDNNLKLIDRADLIVINETCEDAMRNLCNSYHSFSDAWYNDHHASGVKSFAQSDLSWEAVLRIFARITGLKYNASTGKNEAIDAGTCPVLFDYNICSNSLSSDTQKKTISFNGKNARGNNLATGNQTASKANIYKLYLMTQVTSPVTVHNAFLAGRTGLSFTSEGKIVSTNADKYTFSTSGSDDKALYWSPYTLVPYSVIDISATDWGNADKRQAALSLVGINLDVAMGSGKSGIRNRMYIYNSGSADAKKNLVSDYLTKVSLQLQQQKDLKYFKQVMGDAYSDADSLEQTDYTSGEVFYFMLHGDTLYNNLERDIDILELQPASYSHTDEYWFWYISNIAPNITGKITGHPMSTSEFQCNIDDLNSKYDVIFMGTQTEIKNLDGNVINPDMSGIIPKGSDKTTQLAYYHTGNSSSYTYYSVGSFNTVDASGNVTDDDLTRTAVYSGNDFTFAKYKAVAEYLNSKYPIVFDSGFFDGNNINTKKIDTASWIYKMANEVITKKDAKGEYVYKWFKEGSDQADAFLDALMHKTFKLVVEKSPVEYHDRTKTGNTSLTDAQIYINGGDVDNSEKRKLEFTIRIDSVVDDETYRLRLFIDTNGDGKFNAETEQLDNIEIYDTVGGHSGTSNSLKLRAGRSYQITRKLTDDYAGLIPWKLQVVAYDSTGKESSIRDEASGLSAIQISERAKIYVLQIISEHGNTSSYGYSNYSYGDTTVYLPTDNEIYEAYSKRGSKTIKGYGTKPFQSGTVSQTTANDYFNYYTVTGGGWGGYNYDYSAFIDNTRNDSDLCTNAAWFHYYTNNIEEFEVHFVRATASQINTIAGQRKNKQAENSLGTVRGVESFVSGGKTDYRLTNVSKNIYWDDIDMIILGFADHYNSALENNDDGRQLLMDFIEEGKTVLFTFDTTTDVRWSNKSTYKYLANKTDLNYPYVGYNMSKTFCDLLGQDKYGVYNNHGLSSKLSNPVKKNSGSTTYGIDTINLGNAADYDLDYDIPFKANKSMILSSSNLATTIKKKGSYSKDWWGNIDGISESNTTEERVMTQGFSKNAIRTTGYSAVFKATQTNEGQIVRYPYEVGKLAGNKKNTYINIAKTHAQWLQLNMEDDDVVVWFTLFNEKRTDNNGNLSGGDDITENIINDGTNNYYIYNKGNVTFSGVGMADTVLTDDEYRLFVNTMIASFRSQVKPSVPEILNTDKSTENAKDYLYVDYDATAKIGETESARPIGGASDIPVGTIAGTTQQYFAKRVYYTVRNESIVQNKSMTVHYYPVIYDKATQTKIVLYDYPLKNVDTYLQPNDTSELPKKITDLSTESSYVYKMPDYKKSGGGTVLFDGTEIVYENKAEITVPSGCGKVDSGDSYYVDIPISMNYYNNLFKDRPHTTDSNGYNLYSYTYKYNDNTGTERTGTIQFTVEDWFGLDKNSQFEIEIQVVMRYGRDKTKNLPLVGTRGVVFMRRGMFTLD